MQIFLFSVILALLTYFSYALPSASPEESVPSPATCDSSWASKSADELLNLLKASQPPKDASEVQCRKDAADAVRSGFNGLVHCPSVFDFHVPRTTDCRAAEDALVNALGGRYIGWTFGQRDDKGDTCSQADFCLPMSRDAADCRATLEFESSVAPSNRVEVENTLDIDHDMYWLEALCTSWSYVPSLCLLPSYGSLAMNYRKDSTYANVSVVG